MTRLLCIITTFVVAVASGIFLPQSHANLYSSITSYRVDTKIQSRFASTAVTVDFVNSRDCSTIRGFTMQLPLHARVTSLTMNLSNQCSLNSAIETIKKAEEMFDKATGEGEPAALLTAWDATNYELAVSLPPLGNTTVTINFEELLERKQEKVEFQIPISPGVPVDRISAEVLVSEPETGVERLKIDVPNGLSMSTTSHSDTKISASLEALNVEGDTLPRLIRGEYDTEDLPEEGLLVTDGSDCLIHIFNPPSMQDGIPRNIVFVIDVSGSMTGQKLTDTKMAFSAMIEALDSSDKFAVHSFSASGTQSVWGPSLANPSAISGATSFVQNLVAGGGTNLNNAYTNGIGKIKVMQDTDLSEEEVTRVPILVIMTDGKATVGVTSAPEIAQNVKEANSEVEAKIFAIAFGEGADLALLQAIAIQNGGIAQHIYEGYGDADDQMENFVSSELGTVLLSSVDVSFEGDRPVTSKTKTRFPVLAKGSETAVRAKLGAATGSTANGAKHGAEPRSTLTTIRALTTARMGGVGSALKNWTAELQWTPSSDSSSGECQQSFAHAKITELLQFRDAARKIGDAAMSEDAGDYLSPSPCNDNHACKRFRRATENSQTLADLAEEDALQLALDAGVVWPGLTALVTIPNEACDEFYGDNEVCTEGDDIFDPEESSGDPYYGSTSSASALFLHFLVISAGIAVSACMLLY